MEIYKICVGFKTRIRVYIYDDSKTIIGFADQLCSKERGLFFPLFLFAYLLDLFHKPCFWCILFLDTTNIYPVLPIKKKNIFYKVRA